MREEVDFSPQFHAIHAAAAAAGSIVLALGPIHFNKCRRPGTASHSGRPRPLEERALCLSNLQVIISLARARTTRRATRLSRGLVAAPAAAAAGYNGHCCALYAQSACARALKSIDTSVSLARRRDCLSPASSPLPGAPPINTRFAPAQAPPMAWRISRPFFTLLSRAPNRRLESFCPPSFGRTVTVSSRADCLGSLLLLA